MVHPGGSEKLMRILLIDDHPVFRAGLATLLHELDPSVEVVHAGNCHDGLRASRNGALNLAFLDLNLPDGHGLGCLRALKSARPTLPVVLISGDRIGRDVIEQALELGAMGFVPKSEDADAIIAALRSALAGGVFLPAQLAAGQPESPLRLGISREPMPGPGSIAAAVDAAQLGITKRQADVLRYVVQGWPNKHIANKLGISVPVVKKHVSDLLAHCRVVSRTQLVALIAEKGITFGPPEPSHVRDDLAAD
jgi:DNA-binding NarL/FixJ family response regulator